MNVVFPRGNQKPNLTLEWCMRMAKIENDALVLSSEEQARLYKNLLLPPDNPLRDAFMKKVESILYTETDDGFVTTVDIDVPENMFGEEE